MDRRTPTDTWLPSDDRAIADDIPSHGADGPWDAKARRTLMGSEELSARVNAIIPSVGIENMPQVLLNQLTPEQYAKHTQPQGLTDDELGFEPTDDMLVKPDRVSVPPTEGEVPLDLAAEYEASTERPSEDSVPVGGDTLQEEPVAVAEAEPEPEAEPVAEAKEVEPTNEYIEATTDPDTALDSVVAYANMMRANGLPAPSDDRDWYELDRATLNTATNLRNEYFAQSRLVEEMREKASDAKRREEANRYTTMELLNAAFSRENIITSGIQKSNDLIGTNNRREEGYDVYSDIEGYEHFAHLFLGVRNPARAQAVKNGIDRQLENNRILDIHGIGGALAGVAAAVADPITLASLFVPVAGVAGRGMSLAKAIPLSAAGGAGIVGASEVALHSTQTLRTKEESYVAMAAGALIDGAVGGLVVKHSPAYKAYVADAHKRLAEAPDNNASLRRSGSSAAVVSPVEGGAPASGGLLKRAGLFKGRYNPIRMVVELTPQGRLLNSENPETRAMAQELTDVHAAIEGDYVPTSVESLIRLNQSKIDGIEIEYLNLQQQAKGVSTEDFNQGVNDYIRYGTESDIPEINSAGAKVAKMRDSIWDAAFEARVEGTYTVEKVDGVDVYTKVNNQDAPEYFTRVFDHAEIKRNPNQFVESLVTGMRKSNEAHNSKIMSEQTAYVRANVAERDAAQKVVDEYAKDAVTIRAMLKEVRDTLSSLTMSRKNRVKAGKPTDAIDTIMAKRIKERDLYAKQLDDLVKAKKSLDKFYKGFKRIGDKMKKEPDTETLRDAARDVMSKIINMKPADNGGAVTTEALKGRTLSLKDSDIDGFLVKDIPSLMQNYNRSVGNKAVMAKRAGEGDYMWHGQIEGLRTSFNDKSQAALLAGDVKLSNKIQKQGAKEIQDLERVRDRLLGLDHPATLKDTSNRRVTSALRTVRNFNTAAMLGGVALSSIPEAARQVAQYGVMNTLKGQRKALKGLGLSLTKLPKDELAVLVSASARTSLNSPRMATMGDVMDEPALSGIEALSRRVADKLMTFSGIKHFDTDMRVTSAYVMNDGITKSVLKGAPDPAVFKRLGFDNDMDAVLAEIKRHGTKDADGLYNMNIERWTDKTLIEKMEAAVVKESNKITTSAGVGDRPLFMSSELGKTMLQYRTFGLASINRIMVPLMQGDASEIIKGVTLPAVAATFMLMGRRTLQGREPYPTEEEHGGQYDAALAGFAMDVVNYAGVAAILPDAIQTVDKGLDLGVFQSNKYRNRDKWGMILGPTAGTISSALNAANAQTGVDSRVRAIRKILPFQNLFYSRWLVDKAEEATVKGLGGSGMYVD